MLVNGTRTHFFSPSRGIRKREPMCPYIFILCLEVLSNYINHKVDILKWDPITISSRGPHFSYLFFTGDLTLIAKANTKTIHTIHHVLFTFCSLSGQRVNATKYRAVFSPTCNTDICASFLPSVVSQVSGLMLPNLELFSPLPVIPIFVLWFTNC